MSESCVNPSSGVPDSGRWGESSGITLFELLIVVAIIGVLGAISIEGYTGALSKARVTRAIADIRIIEKIISSNEIDGDLPESLNDIGWGNRTDPWGNPYQYLNFEVATDGTGNINGVARKDRFLVPINTTYDLYSMGPDGKSKKPLAAKLSRDDIVRAADGAFVGLASDF